MSDFDWVSKSEELSLVDQQEVPIQQWVYAVDKFSSQYGTARGNWGARCIEGPTNVYPAYGDNVNSWAPQSYSSVEYLEFHYEKPCIPSKMEIYETFTPGALIKIQGKSLNGEWVVLWSGSPDRTAIGTSRIFTANFKQTNSEMTHFRFDIDATGWPGWYEIDAILLSGMSIQRSASAFTRPERKTLAGDLLSLFTTQSGDITLITPNETKLRAHSDILLARCPFLLKSHGDTIHVNEHPDVLKVLLTFIYSDIADIAGPLAIGVFVAAKKYDLDALALAAKSRFEKGLTVGNVFKALSIVDGISELRASCLKFLVKEPSALSSSHLLSREHLVELLPMLAARLISQ